MYCLELLETKLLNRILKYLDLNDIKNLSLTSTIMAEKCFNNELMHRFVLNIFPEQLTYVQDPSVFYLDDSVMSYILDPVFCFLRLSTRKYKNISVIISKEQTNELVLFFYEFASSIEYLYIRNHISIGCLEKILIPLTNLQELIVNEIILDFDRKDCYNIFPNIRSLTIIKDLCSEYFQLPSLIKIFYLFPKIKTLHLHFSPSEMLVFALTVLNLDLVKLIFQYDSNKYLNLSYLRLRYLKVSE